MSASIREQIVEAIVAALSDPSGPAGLTVHRFRARPLSQDQLPAQVVYAVEERTIIAGNVSFTTPTAITAGLTGDLVEHQLLVAVETRVMGDPPDVALEPFVVWATQQVLKDTSFGGLSINALEYDTKWTAQDAATGVFGATSQEFVIQYFSLAADPTSGNR